MAKIFVPLNEVFVPGYQGILYVVKAFCIAFETVSHCGFLDLLSFPYAASKI